MRYEIFSRVIIIILNPLLLMFSGIDADNGAGGRPRKRRRIAAPSPYVKKQEKMIIKSKSKQFPGCIKKPVINGTSVIAINDEDSTDDEISFTRVPHSTPANTSNQSSSSNVKETATAKSNESSGRAVAKRGRSKKKSEITNTTNDSPKSSINNVNSFDEGGETSKIITTKAVGQTKRGRRKKSVETTDGSSSVNKENSKDGSSNIYSGRQDDSDNKSSESLRLSSGASSISGSSGYSSLPSTSSLSPQSYSSKPTDKLQNWAALFGTRDPDKVSVSAGWHVRKIFMSHSLLWRHIVLLTVGVYSSNHRVLYTIGISMTRRFQKSVGPSVAKTICLHSKL